MKGVKRHFEKKLERDRLIRTLHLENINQKRAKDEREQQRNKKIKENTENG